MKRQTLEDLKNVMKTLRSPQGCPWDKQQTPESLTPFAVEEALELEDAILHKQPGDIKEELGDLLFQIVFQAQMYEEKGLFSLDDVIDHLSRKMIERHPHVFGGDASSMAAESGRGASSVSQVPTSQSVVQGWEKNKNKNLSAEQIFTFPKTFTPLLSAVKIGKKSRTINFDWLQARDVFQHFLSETKELKQAFKKGKFSDIQEELGDTLFTLAQVARHLKVDPDKALRLANHKVVDRIMRVHRASELPWDQFAEMSLKQKDKLWDRVKKESKKESKKAGKKAKTPKAKPLASKTKKSKAKKSKSKKKTKS